MRFHLGRLARHKKEIRDTLVTFQHRHQDNIQRFMQACVHLSDYLVDDVQFLSSTPILRSSACHSSAFEQAGCQIVLVLVLVIERPLLVFVCLASCWFWSFRYGTFALP